MILFATHGNAEIGMGHIVRTLTLAQELRRQTDEPIRFHVPEHDGIARYQVIAAGFGFWDGEPLGRVISDYASGEHLLVNATEHYVLADVVGEAKRGPIIFATHPQGHTDYDDAYAGALYAILRPAFAEARAKGRPMRCGRPRVLLSFGGADPGNLLEHATASLAGTPYTLTAVLGPAYRYASAYIERWGTRVTTHRPGVTVGGDMATLMGGADVMVCSGGMTPIEAACVGTPTIVLAQNEREHKRMMHWQHAWTGYYLGLGSTIRMVDVQEATTKLLADPITLGEMSMLGRTLVDGQGAQRVARVILHAQRKAIDAA